MSRSSVAQPAVTSDHPHLPPPAPPSETSTGTMPGGWRETLMYYSTMGYGAQATSRASNASGSSAGLGRSRPVAQRQGLDGMWASGSVDRSARGTGSAASATADGKDMREQAKARTARLALVADSVLFRTDSLDITSRLLVVAACRFTQSSPEFSQAQVLDCLAGRLNDFAAGGPYSVALLASPAPHPPSTAALVSAYLSLSRTARKNVEHVHVLGGGWWSRTLINLFTTTLMSGSAVRKRKVLSHATMSDLAQAIGTANFLTIEFPLESYAANSKIEKEIQLPASKTTHSPVFGVELEKLMGEQGQLGLPRIVEDCCRVLEQQGPQSVGVFRRSPSAANVSILRAAYDRGHAIRLGTLDDAPYLAASLLKLFLRSLPTPIFEPNIYALARECPLPSSPDSAAFIRAKIVPHLTPCAQLVLTRVVAVLHAIANESDTNLMDSNNLAVLLCPNLMGGLGASQDELDMCRVPGMQVGTMRGLSHVDGPKDGKNSLGGVLKTMIERFDEAFDETKAS